MRMAFIAGLIGMMTVSAYAEERTFRSGNRLYTLDFSSELIFKLRENPMEGFTTWDFATDDWVVRAKRGAALSINETLQPYDEFLAYWRSIPANDGKLEEHDAYAILYTKDGKFLSMIARSTCGDPCHLVFFVGAAPDRLALKEDTISRLRKTFEAGNYVRDVD